MKAVPGSMSMHERRISFRTGFLGLVVLCALTVPVSSYAIDFRYLHVEGQSYRIVSEVNEEVWVNGVFSHTAYILNRISVATLGVEGTSGRLRATYQTSEESRNAWEPFKLNSEYTVDFMRDELGGMTVPRSAFVPTVRNVPSFTGMSVTPGDSWVLEGSEVHDLRRALGITEPFEFPIKVAYAYKGPIEVDGRTLHEIAASYTIFKRYPRKGSNPEQPVQVSGQSDQTILWDLEAGRPTSYKEDFIIVLTSANGTSRQFQGRALASIQAAPAKSQAELRDEVEDAVHELDLANVTVREDPEGVTLSIENIQFAPDSAILLPVEREKLSKIAGILQSLPGYDIAVGGHTALAGTVAGRQRLSEERARAVGQFLLEAGVRKREEIMIQGHGADKPLADNGTEAGREKNRRVEITILKN